MSPPWKLIALLSLVALAVSIVAMAVMSQRESWTRALANKAIEAELNTRAAFHYIRGEFDKANQSRDQMRENFESLQAKFTENMHVTAQVLVAMGCQEFKNTKTKDGTPIDWAVRCRLPDGTVGTIILSGEIEPLAKGASA